MDPTDPAVLLPSAISGVTRGFTEQDTDSDLRLINMTGRIYDPKLGRFLTPDPFVQAPLLSESLNRYSYAWNNPLKLIDPSGFENVGDDEGGAPPGGRSETDPIPVLPSPPQGLPVAPKQTPVSSTNDDDGINVSLPPLVSVEQADISCCAGGSKPSEWADLPSERVPVPEMSAISPAEDWRQDLGALTTLSLPPERLAAVVPFAGPAEEMSYATAKHFKDIAVNIWKFVADKPEPIMMGSRGPIFESREKLGYEAGKGIFEIGLSVLTVGAGTPEIESVEGLEVFEVGTFDALKPRQIVGDMLDIHHVPQASPAEQIIPGYLRSKAPSIVLPTIPHRYVLRSSGPFTGTARQLLARDIRSLHGWVPNSSLQELRG